MKFHKKTTLLQVAEQLGIEYIGTKDFAITGLNEIHMVESGDITFVDHPKYYDKALKSAATTILINKRVECPEGKALLISEDPFADFNRLILHHRPPMSANKMVSDLAEIDPSTTIYPGAFVGDHVKIGKNCLIMPNVTIYNHTIIGDNVIIHANSVIGADAYYFQRKPEGYRKFNSCGRVLIGSNVEIGSCCTIDKGVTGDTSIGFGVKFDNHVQVGHDTKIGKNCLIGSHCAIAGVTKLEDDVILWAKVAINKDIVIGKGVIILATSAVDKSIKGEGCSFFGSPAVPVIEAWREKATIKRLPKIIDELRAKSVID